MLDYKLSAILVSIGQFLEIQALGVLWRSRSTQEQSEALQSSQSTPEQSEPLRSSRSIRSSQSTPEQTSPEQSEPLRSSRSIWSSRSCSGVVELRSSRSWIIFMAACGMCIWDPWLRPSSLAWELSLLWCIEQWGEAILQGYNTIVLAVYTEQTADWR